MESLKLFYNNYISHKFLSWALIGALFFLPLNLMLNNILFSVFYIGFGLKLLLNSPKDIFASTRKHWKKVLVLTSPFFISVLGSFYAPDFYEAFREWGRLLPLALVVPMILYDSEFFGDNLKKMLYALTLGCLLAACICWGLTLYEIAQNGHSITDLFSQRYSYHYLSARIGNHTPYLGLFVAGAIFFLVKEGVVASNKLRSLWLFFAGAILFLFLLNLVARTALFTLIVGSAVYLIYKRKYVIVFIGVIGLLAFGTFAYYEDHNFLRDRIFKSVNVFEETTIFSKKDGRFNRWEASVEVFKMFPILGPGTSGEDQYRKQFYYNNRDSVAYNDNYNSHNQFLEYLSTFGLLGGFVFLMILIVLIKESKAKTIARFFVFAFIMAGLTESILERSWGVFIYLLVLMIVFGSNSKAYEMD